METNALKSLFIKSLDADAGSDATAWGLLFLRGLVGVIIFYVHGWHKLEGGLEWLRAGTRWPLADEVAAMHFPAPIASAFAATAVQFLCAPLLALGFYTRLNAAALTAVLSVAIAQNLGANRDPQLALLYTLTVAAFVLIGGGRFSLDARVATRSRA
jgi:putative oxidoreductase